MIRVFNDKIYRFKKIDVLIVLVIMLLYGLFSFYRLGDFYSPNTFYRSKDKQDIIIDLGSTKHISKIKLFNGEVKSDYIVYLSDNGDEYDYLKFVRSKGAFSWDMTEVSARGRYLKLVFDDVYSIGEIGIFDDDVLIEDTKVFINNRIVEDFTDENNLIPDKVSYMNSSYFDEVYFARTAYEYVFNLKTYEWTHPPLGKVIQAVPIYITHYMSPFNYRLMGNVSGILLCGVMYFFGILLFKKRKWGILSSVFMCLDTFHFAHTRMGTVDSHLVLFMTLSILFMFLFTTKDKYRYLLLSGIFFGLSISVKWTGFYGGIVLAILFFGYLFKHKKFNFDHIAIGTILFVFLPLLIYSAIFMLFPNNLYRTDNFDNIIKENKEMYTYHSKLKEKHSFSSKWYTWPISYRPVWYHKADAGLKEESISGVGNLVLWLFGIVGIIFSIIKVFVMKDKNSLLIVLCFFSLWLPYAIIPRVMFLYHYFPVLPFIFLALVNLLVYLDEKIRMKYISFIILILSYLFFMFYYPVVSGYGVSKEYISRLELFDSWDFS